MAGGAAVAAGISLVLDKAGDRWDHVVATKDWHIDPGAHFSAHPDFVESWPAHCVVGTGGADFHPELATGRIEAVFHKGEHAAAYSGFEGHTDDRRRPGGVVAVARRDRGRGGGHRHRPLRTGDRARRGRGRASPPRYCSS